MGSQEIPNDLLFVFYRCCFVHVFYGMYNYAILSLPTYCFYDIISTCKANDQDRSAQEVANV